MDRWSHCITDRDLWQHPLILLGVPAPFPPLYWSLPSSYRAVPCAFLAACPAMSTLSCRHQPGCCWTWGAPSACCFHSFCPDGISSALLSQQMACFQKRRKSGGSSRSPTFLWRCVIPAWTIGRQRWLCTSAGIPSAGAGGARRTLAADILTMASLTLCGRQKEESPHWCVITTTNVITSPSSRIISRLADQYVLCRPYEQLAQALKCKDFCRIHVFALKQQRAFFPRTDCIFSVLSATGCIQAFSGYNQVYKAFPWLPYQFCLEE